MKAQIFENVRELGAYLESKNLKNVEVKFFSAVVGTTKDKSDNKVFEMVDRFLVIES